MYFNKIIFALYIITCYKSYGQVIKLSDDGSKGTTVISTIDDITLSEYKVVDGFFVEKGQHIPSPYDMVSVKRVTDSGKLSKIGVEDVKKSYTFFNSSVTPFHEYVYRITKSPLEWGMNIPLIVDQHVITPDDYSKLNVSDTSKISNVKFVPKSDVLLKYSARIAFGAILVELK